MANHPITGSQIQNEPLMQNARPAEYDRTRAGPFLCASVGRNRQPVVQLSLLQGKGGGNGLLAKT
jgi:hypothetical protein